MSESISQFSAIELPDHIAKEFSIDEKTGQGSVSMRGLARLCDISRGAWGKDGHLFTQKIDEYLTSEGFEGGHFLVNKQVILERNPYVSFDDVRAEKQSSKNPV